MLAAANTLGASQGKAHRHQVALYLPCLGWISNRYNSQSPVGFSVSLDSF